MSIFFFFQEDIQILAKLSLSEKISTPGLIDKNLSNNLFFPIVIKMTQAAFRVVLKQYASNLKGFFVLCRKYPISNTNRRAVSSKHVKQEY
jgi:hypothetical protein